MNMVISRFFGIKSPRFSSFSKTETRLPLETLRESLLALLHDCTDLRAQRVVYKIKCTRDAAELWLMRSELHQCIATLHSQSEAARRINSLVHMFEGWVPASQLTRI